MKKAVTKLTLMLLLALLNTVLIAPTVLARPEQETILRIAIDYAVSTFNPLVGARDIGQAVWFSTILFEPLMLVLFNGSYVPWLAKSWEILDNGTRYVFHLDERAKWSDGVPVTANDVVVTWNLTVQYIGIAAYLQEIVIGARAVDDHTVEFLTTAPVARWYFIFGMIMVFPAHIYGAIEDPLSYEPIDDTSKFITTSPWRYDSFKTGEWWLFKKRPDYWKKEHMPIIDGILLRYTSDMSLYPYLLMRGEVDAALPYPIYLIPQIVGQPNIQIWKFPYPQAQEYVAVNTRLYPLSMKEVRQAIDLAIDKVDIAQNYFYGYGMPGNRSQINLAGSPEYLVPEAVWPGFYKSHEECVAEANRILDGLGFARGPDGIRVTPNGTKLSFKYVIQSAPITTIVLRAGQRIVENLREIGIEAVYTPLAIFEFFMQVFFAETKDWGFAQGRYGEFPEPWMQQVSAWAYTEENAPTSMTGWYNATMMDLTFKALKTINREEFIECVKQINRIYAEELPAITVVFFPLWIWAFRTDKITNWNPDISTLVSGFGYPQPMRPLTVTELTPVGWTPPATPTPVVTPTPTPIGPTPTPFVTPTPTPTAAPAGLTTEQMVLIVVVIIIIIAVIGYFAAKARRKSKE
ncbi:MAG: ABC transporter substrate-binding protein [Candidatus Bathyarchaeia archaeon]